MSLTAKLVPPFGDKGYSVQFFGEVLPIRPSLIGLLHSKEMRPSHPFLQGDCSDWLMVEFWTSDLAVILAATKLLSEQLRIEITIPAELPPL